MENRHNPLSHCRDCTMQLNAYAHSECVKDATPSQTCRTGFPMHNWLNRFVCVCLWKWCFQGHRMYVTEVFWFRWTKFCRVIFRVWRHQPTQTNKKVMKKDKIREYTTLIILIHPIHLDRLVLSLLRSLLSRSRSLERLRRSRSLWSGKHDFD